MKLIWSPAITLDGYIAKSDGDSDWVSNEDSEQFNELVKKCGCVIVGRKTFDQYKGDVFPIEGATTFVWTRHPNINEQTGGVKYISGSTQEVLTELMGKGYSHAVLAGGGITNNAFVTAGLVDEVIVTIYPLMFGNGIKMLSSEYELKLELIEAQKIGGGVVRQKYKVLK